jgi:DDE superfamily endonuclease/Winged helix-turn helix
LIALLHRLGFVYHKPQRVPRKLDEAQQRAFIASYEKLLNRLEPDESVVFVDAVHPTHQARPAGCWAPKDVAIGIEQTTGRRRLNIHGAINLETGQTQMLEAPKIDAMSLIALLVAIEAAYSGKKWIHVFLDNATYHHAILVREWLGQPGRRIRLYFIPSYCPHLDPIERCLREPPGTSRILLRGHRTAWKPLLSPRPECGSPQSSIGREPAGTSRILLRGHRSA